MAYPHIADIPPTHDFSSLPPPPMLTTGALRFPVIDHTVAIVAAYVSHVAVSQSDLLKLIQDVHGAVAALAFPVITTTPAAELVPAVPVKKSITPDFIICLEDGQKYKSLKRHLRTAYNMSPEEYRAKWGLPADYPMAAPNYSAQRSQLAKDNGLGKKS